MHLIVQIILYAIAAFLIGFVVSFFVVNIKMFNVFFKRAKDEAMKKEALSDGYYDNCREEIKAAAKRMEALPFERISVTSDDGLKLSARYYNTGSDSLVVFVPGFHSSAWNCFGVIGEDLKDRGYDFLVIDVRAHWESEGEYLSYGNFESKDILRWLDGIAGFDLKKIVLYGTSMGANAIALAADKIEDDRVKAIVLDCGFRSLDSLLTYLLKQRHVPKFLLFGTYCLGKKKAKIDLRDSTEKHLEKTKIPVLFLHGESDVVVSVEDSRINYAACSSEKELITVAGAGHSVSAIEGGEKTRKRIIDCLDR